MTDALTLINLSNSRLCVGSKKRRVDIEPPDKVDRIVPKKVGPY